VIAQHKKLTNVYYWLRKIVPPDIFLLLLLCSCSIPGVGNQATANPCVGSTGASGATAEEVQIAKAVFQAINHERAANGIASLGWCPALANSARQHDLAMEKAGTLSHQLDGEAELGDRETQQGVSWTWAGENIGEAPDLTVNGAMELHQAMMAEQPPDDGHRQNILSGNYTVVGVFALLDQQNNVLWLTEDFAQV
jgi:uncharacterized protein YkwD